VKAVPPADGVLMVTGIVEEVPAASKAGRSEGGRVSSVVHVVLVEWGAETPDDVKEAARQSAQGFRTRIDGVLSVVEGPSTSPENLENGFDYGLVITFADAAARDAYLPHPVHRVLADLIGEHSARVIVYDIESGE
jgi:hypothetical protein